MQTYEEVRFYDSDLSVLVFPVFLPSKKQKWQQKCYKTGYWSCDVWMLSVLFVMEEALFWIYTLNAEKKCEHCVHKPKLEKEVSDLPTVSRNF